MSEEEENQTFDVRDENIHVTATLKPGSRVLMNIVIEPKAVEAAYGVAVKSINREVSLPGFRKGKAPTDIIEKKYDRQIKSEWQNLVVNTAFQEALNLLKVRVFRQESIKCSALDNLSRDQEAQVTIECEIAPRVPVIDIEAIKLENVEKEPITDEDIENMIENLRLYYARWTDIVDRAVQEGDYVDLDIEKVDEPKQTICRDTRFYVKDRHMAKWMQKLIIGHNKDEVVEGYSENEEGHKEFKSAQVQITIKSIMTAEKPELNDEFAKRAGANDVEDMRKSVIMDLERRSAEESFNEMREQVDGVLLAQYHFDIPTSVLEDEKEARLTELRESMKKKNVSEEKILEKEQQIQDQLSHDVEVSYRLYYLYYAFANKHNLMVTNEEVSKELAMRLFGTTRDWKNIQNEFNHLRGRISSQIMMRKCRDYIVAHAKRV